MQQTALYYLGNKCSNNGVMKQLAVLQVCKHTSGDWFVHSSVSVNAASLFDFPYSCPVSNFHWVVSTETCHLLLIGL